MGRERWEGKEKREKSVLHQKNKTRKNKEECGVQTSLRLDRVGFFIIIIIINAATTTLINQQAQRQAQQQAQQQPKKNP